MLTAPRLRFGTVVAVAVFLAVIVIRLAMETAAAEGPPPPEVPAAEYVIEYPPGTDTVTAEVIETHPRWLRTVFRSWRGGEVVRTDTVRLARQPVGPQT